MKHSPLLYVHLYRLRDQELTPKNILLLRKALMQYFKTSSFVRKTTGNHSNEQVSSSMVHNGDMDSNVLNLFSIPSKGKEENPRAQSYISALRKIGDQVSLSVSMHTTHMRMNIPQILHDLLSFCCCYILHPFLQGN